MILLNILLSAMILEVNIRCMSDKKENGEEKMQCSFDHAKSKFGFSNLAEWYRSVPYILLVFYTLCSLSFLPILITVLKLFHKVHPDVYGEIKKKMIFFFTCYTLYKGARIYLYYMIVCRRI